MEAATIEMFSAESILSRAREKWDGKSGESRLKSGRKYMAFFVKLKLPMNDWGLRFSELTDAQRSVIVKGELIRTYDSLPNSDKTRIKEGLGLSKFQSKWYRLSSHDKNILLKHVTTTKQEIHDSRIITDAVGAGMPSCAREV